MEVDKNVLPHGPTASGSTATTRNRQYCAVQWNQDGERARVLLLSAIVHWA